MRRTDRQIHDGEMVESILRQAQVCHLALVDRGAPYLVALNYGFHFQENQLTLYFHCARDGRKLDILRSNDSGYFFIDTDHRLVEGQSACQWSMKYRSVAGSGRVETVDDEALKVEGLLRIMEHHSGRTDFDFDSRVLEHVLVLRMRVDAFTAKSNHPA